MTTPGWNKSLSLVAASLVLGLAVPHAGAQDDTQTPAQSPVQPTGQAPGQPSGQGDGDPAGSGAAPVRFNLADYLAQTRGLPANLRAGARAHRFRESQQVAGTVVITDSAETAAEAIRGWRGLVRYPVLIDDGSVLAAENIARFVRAFEPGLVVRLTPPTPPEWPDDLEGRASRLVGLLGATVQGETEIKDVTAHLARLRELGIGPQGVVVLDPLDPAWIAGFALAVGRGQIVTFITADGRTNGRMSGDEMRAMAGSIQTQLERVNARWAEVGDEIDAVTITANIPLRVGLGVDGEDEKALTDLIGRHRAGIGNRWAWAGAIFGDSQTALYRAMCGLFLPVDSAWLFDGYGRGDPWDLYDSTTTSRAFQEAGIETVVHDIPANRVRDWRRAAAGGLETDLILVNSKGTVGFFQLGDGKAYPGDTPLLDIPAAMHIVHSWSARVPDSPRSVAGRWLEHGVYAYYGSIDEPYLSAFVPTPKLAGRMLVGFPFGVAVRVDGGPPWKLNVLGDPLITFNPGSTAGSRIAQPVPINPSEDLADTSAAALKAGEYAEGIREMVLAGRDADVARLARAMIDQRPENVSNAVARAALLSLYREGHHLTMAKAFALLSPDDQKILLFQDALWHAGRIVLSRGPSTVYEGLLGRNLRPGQMDIDAIEVAQHIASRAGAGEAVVFLERVMPEIKPDRAKEEVGDAIRRFGGQRRP